MEQTERKFKREKPLPHSTFGFGIGDCPIWLYRQFDSDVKEKYQNKYWIKLMDVMRKAECYDAFIKGGIITPQQPIQQEKEEVQEEEQQIKTIGR